ncbi:hypothetical protein G7Y89_g9922 [Cudoniella acicularis]|uniref:Uncharacterized protein n=1 Tax=Cudoniella acicularis TaxID=354080 RepID=A0A8H4W241_9HELO|nr:hypothetical protein G7Y89_g9922 [Cudoniella acicularis]
MIKPIEITVKDPAIFFVNIYTSLVYSIYYSFFEEGGVDSMDVRIDPQTGPDHATIIRFIDTVVKHIKVRGSKALAPLRMSIKKGILSMFAALIFEYPKFNLSKHEYARIDTVIDDLSDEGKLLRGRKREQF